VCCVSLSSFPPPRFITVIIIIGECTNHEILPPCNFVSVLLKFPPSQFQTFPSEP
jgi:hypothetical protein